MYLKLLFTQINKTKSCADCKYLIFVCRQSIKVFCSVVNVEMKTKRNVFELIKHNFCFAMNWNLVEK